MTQTRLTPSFYADKTNQPVKFMDWQTTFAAVWRPNTTQLKAITRVDDIHVDALVGIDRQKTILSDNTERFINGKPSNNVLLWGARGTGKSSLIKAVFNKFSDKKLRIIEVFKEDLHYLHDIVDQIRDQDFYFIIYCDDFAFAAGDHSYSSLKSVLEGSLEAAPDNVLLYATSNRRHLIPQTMKENLDSKVINGELHLSDAIEEKIALSDRFGLSVAFHPISKQQYLKIVDSYFPDTTDEKREELHIKATRFAVNKASRSGRTAKQFFNSYGWRLDVEGWMLTSF